MGVCMSRDMQEQLIAHGLPRERLCFIHPAHDGVIRPRKLRIGITSNVYDSGCKREHLVADLASRLDPNDFAFIIMGTGWASVIARLRACSIEVEDLGPFHYQTYQELIPALDYYLYTGQDEGSMGFIDALAAGVRTIVTPQGFHLDVPGGITHAFNELGELARIFDGIAAERRGRVEAVASWTWAEYARKHVRLWQYLLLKRDGQTIPEALKQELILMGIGAGAGGPSSPRTPAAESAPATKAARPIVVIDDLPKSWVTRLARFLERKYFIGREKLRHATGKRLERPATPRRPEE
jgi:hypothetical protein